MDNYFENLRLLQTLTAMYSVFGQEVLLRNNSEEQEYITGIIYAVLASFCEVTQDLIDLRIIDINSGLPRGLISKVLN